MQYTRRQVRRYLREQQLSGLPVSEYCRRNNVNTWTFRGWRKRYGKVPRPVRMPFVRFEVPTARVVEVLTGSRATVRIPLDGRRGTAAGAHCGEAQPVGVMFTLPSSVQVYVCGQPTDMRKSFDSLAALAEQTIRQNPLSGHLFVFFSRLRNRTKILYWDRTGYCLYYKRLEEGTFAVPEGRACLSLPELTLVLEGIELTGARRRRRFSLAGA